MSSSGATEVEEVDGICWAWAAEDGGGDGGGVSTISDGGLDVVSD